MPPQITRRNFLKAGALGAASTILAGCQNPRRWVILEPYVKPPEEQIAGVATWYASTCRMCPAGCGIIVRIMNGRALKIEGNPEHPLNRGKLCPRGQAGLQLLYNPDRLKEPVKQASRGTRQFTPLAWNDAINDLSNRIQSAGNGVAIWLGSTISGHVYDLFSRMAKGLGAQPPVVYDLYSAMVGYPIISSTTNKLFDIPGVPAYSLSNADVIFSFGADLFGTGTSTTRYGIEYGAFRGRANGKRGFLAQFESKMTTAGVKADRWIPVQPGYEGFIAQAIAGIIASQALGPAERVGRAGSLAGKVDINEAVKASGMTLNELNQLAQIFATAEHPIAIPGQGLMGQPQAADAVAAIEALNLIAGNTNTPGGVVLPTHSQLPGVSSVPVSSYKDVQDLIGRMRNGQVKLLLVYGVNPAYELPAQSGISDALSKVPSLVSFASIVDETAVQADLILPERTYLESWGYSMVSPDFGTPIVGSQQPVVTPLYDARSAGDILISAGKAIPAVVGSYPWSDEVAFMKEVVSGLPAGQYGGGSADAAFAAFQQHGGWWSPSTSAAASAPHTEATAPQISAPQYQGSENDYPYFLNLYLSPLLSDGRGAAIPWLQGVPDPVTTETWQTWVEINPETAKNLGISDGDELKVTSQFGEVTGLAYLIRGIRPDTISMNTGQGHTDYGRYARDRGSNPIQLVGGQATAGGENLAFGNVRVKVARTGKRSKLATFEFKPGVEQGFINADFPGR